MHNLKLVLRRYAAAHDLLHYVRSILRPSYRRQHRALLEQLTQFRSRSSKVLSTPLGNGSSGTAVILGWSRFEHALAESVVRKALELAGFSPHVLTEPTPATRAVYATVGVKAIESFSRYCPQPDNLMAEQLLSGVLTFGELVELKWKNVSVGKYVSSSLMRQTRQGSLDLSLPEIRKKVIKGLAASISYVIGAERMVTELVPTILIQVDRGYSPYGEIFDVCVNKEVPVVTWNIAHRDNTIMLKRYLTDNRDAHPSSLSRKSWHQLCSLQWGDSHRKLLNQELTDSYNSGEWYGEVGTQFNKRKFDREDIAAQFGLNPDLKTAIVFAHIFWDATFFWGEDLFRDYEDWFIETVRAACTNDRLNWLIKVHPANLVKDRRDGVCGEPSELIALRNHIGPLPRHVKVIPADTNITTLSLFDAADYCITVRGTVGMEAALLGRSVLTAGTGRYDRHGFTMDFDSQDAYLDQLSHLEDLPSPTREMQELAERYSYGVFVCRPVRLRCFDLRFAQDDTATLVAGCSAHSTVELAQARELVAIADWLRSEDEDLLIFPDTEQIE